MPCHPPLNLKQNQEIKKTARGCITGLPTEPLPAPEILCFFSLLPRIYFRYISAGKDIRTRFQKHMLFLQNMPFLSPKDFLNTFGEVSYARTIFSGFLCIFFEYVINTIKISSSVKDYTIKSNSHLSLTSLLCSHSRPLPKSNYFYWFLGIFPQINKLCLAFFPLSTKSWKSFHNSTHRSTQLY